MKRKQEEKECSECGEINLVGKSFNCTKCRAYNKFVIIEEETTKETIKKGNKKKWLN